MRGGGGGGGGGGGIQNGRLNYLVSVPVIYRPVMRMNLLNC